MSHPDLDAVEQRVLGSLLEKQRTVPDAYPLSGNALRAACNQTSSREPVLDLDAAVVEAAARALKQRGLLRIVWSDTGRRTLRYHQALDEVLGLDQAQSALLAVLLLRGGQTAGELRTRTERLHAFADKAAVEDVLRGLAARDEPVVLELPRRGGRQDTRWVHRLGVSTDTEPTQPGQPVPPSVVDPAARDDRVRIAYATVAASYAAALADELDDLPFERWFLDRVAAHAIADGGPVIDVGSGPGHVAAYLDRAGVRASGLDLVPEMVEQARLRFPAVTYAVGDLRRLVRPPDADGWSAVLAWYSLVHLAEAELPDALAGLVRPLRPGGALVLALHAGDEVLGSETWFGHEVDLDFVLHDPDRVCAMVRAAGLVDLEWYRRGPVVARGERTERLYVLARRPASVTP